LRTASGGNYEELDFSGTVDVVVTDTIDTTTVTLSASDVLEGADITVTAEVDFAPQTDLVLTLNNGEEITILAGQTSGSVTFANPNTDDVYKDGETLTYSVASASGGNYEELDISGTVDVVVTDTIDTTTVTLSASDVLEGADITVTAEVDFAPQTDLVLTLNNGEEITILAGQTSGSVTFANPNTDDVYKDGETLTYSVASASGGNYEELDISGTVDVVVTDTIDTTTISFDSFEIRENSTTTVRVYIDSAPWEDLSFDLVNGDDIIGNGEFVVSDLSYDGVRYYVDVEVVIPRLDHPLQGEDEIVWENVSIIITDGGDEFELLATESGTITIFDTVPELSVEQPGVQLIDNEVGSETSGTYHLDIGQDVQSLASSLSLIWVNKFGDYEIIKSENEADRSVTFTASTGETDLFQITFGDLDSEGNGAYTFTLLQPKPGSIGEVDNLFSFFGNNNSPKEFEDIDANASFVDSEGNTVSFSNGLFGLRIDGGERIGNEINHPEYFQGDTSDPVDNDVKVKVSNTDLGVGSNTVQSTQNQYLLFDVREAGSAEIEFTELTIGVAKTSSFTADQTQVRVTIFYKDGTTSSLVEAIGSGGRTDGGGQLVIDVPETGKAVDYFTVEALNDNFKIDGFGYKYQVVVDPDDYEYTFELQATDSDGDVATSQQFSIQVDGDADGFFTSASPDTDSQTPIAIDLDGDGSISYLSADAGVTFDYGWGLVATAWVAASDGLLVFDYDSSIYAATEDGLQPTAENIVLTLWAEEAATDMEALALFFDSNGDGIFDAADEHWSSFGVWQDLNGDGLIDIGEFQTLSYYEIVGFELGYIEGSEAFLAADGGVEVFGQFTVLYDDGSTGIADDFAFLVEPDQEPSAEFDAVEADVVVLIEEFLAEEAEGSDGDAFSSDVAIEDSALASEEVFEVAEMVEQLLADSAISDDTLSEYQQELEQSIDDSLADVSFELTIEPTADAIVALDAAALELPDAATDGIDTAFDVVDDSSYSI
jgi:hypothetical protein